MTWADPHPLLIPEPNSGRVILTHLQPSRDWMTCGSLSQKDLCHAGSLKVIGHSRPILTGLKVGATLRRVVICLSLSGGWSFHSYSLLCSLWPERQKGEVDGVLWKTHFAPGFSSPERSAPP